MRSFLEARLFGAPLSAWVRMPQELLDSFGGHVDRIEVVAVAVPLMVLAAVATHLTARASLRHQASAAPVEAAAATGSTETVVRFMPLRGSSCSAVCSPRSPWRSCCTG